MESTSPTISVIDLITSKEKKYAYALEDTILDLKRKITLKEKYDDTEGDKVQIFWACIPLKNNELVINYAGKDEGIFIHFETYAIACKATGDIFVWLGKKKCVKLYAGAEENIKIPRNGHFAVMRSK